MCRVCALLNYFSNRYRIEEFSGFVFFFANEFRLVSSLIFRLVKNIIFTRFECHAQNQFLKTLFFIFVTNGLIWIKFFPSTSNFFLIHVLIPYTKYLIQNTNVAVSYKRYYGEGIFFIFIVYKNSPHRTHTVLRGGGEIYFLKSFRLIFRLITNLIQKLRKTGYHELGRNSRNCISNKKQSHTKDFKNWKAKVFRTSPDSNRIYTPSSTHVRVACFFDS